MHIPDCCCAVCKAVKFGRMSKKQRERVEDEANFHKQRQRLSEITPTTASGGSASIHRHDDISSSTNNISSDHLNGYLL